MIKLSTPLMIDQATKVLLEKFQQVLKIVYNIDLDHNHLLQELITFTQTQVQEFIDTLIPPPVLSGKDFEAYLNVVRYDLPYLFPEKSADEVIYGEPEE